MEGCRIHTYISIVAYKTLEAFISQPLECVITVEHAHSWALALDSLASHAWVSSGYHRVLHRWFKETQDLRRPML